ncbi:hypothetical protein [Gracilibacillus kekensis]|uniref:DUF4367 domain-containing protein n=1 Tax=Gracilibacillus kekensis TaxID=1027249 RepID=A0A1M7JBU1_9BACI|nr:hypothetical protein [Gracilibacillus kekensis]SHM50388.1 hypothetical protein SAMN05216179_0310 [Gracilibacillus kekensis]
MRFFQQVITAIMFVLVCTGCNTQSAVPEGFHSYEKNEIEEAVEVLDFNPELPSFIPVLAEILVTDRFQIEENGLDAFDITMFTNENDIFSIQFINGEMEEQKDYNQIRISDDIKGYYQNQSYSQTLKWMKNGITYQLIYRPSKKSLTKEKLVEVAKSFQST